MSKVRILASIFMAFALGSSCQGRNPEKNDRMAQAHQKIDQGDYSAAINILEDLQSSDQRPQVKMSLASAYAARAGVKLESLLKFIDETRIPVSDEMIYSRPVFLRVQKILVSYNKVLPQDLKNNLRGLGKSLAAFDIYRNKIQTLPYVSEEKRPDLLKAEDILSSVTTKGAKLYRATLSLVILRSDLDDGLEVWSKTENHLEQANTESSNNDLKRLFCSVDLNSFPDWLGGQVERAVSISEDLKIAFPSKRNDFTAFSEKTRAMHEQIPRLNEISLTEICR
jgi:hypothetical protein